MLALLGVVAGLGLVPWSLPWLTLPALALALRTMTAGRGRFADGWAFGVGYFGLTLHWIYNPFLVDAGTDGWMAPFAVASMVGGMALFWGAAVRLAGWLAPRSGIGLVTAWTGAEVARSLVLTGFPWALIGHVWTETPLAQLAAWTGAQGLTLLTLLAALALAQALRPGARRLWAAAPLVLGGVAWLALDPGPPPPLAPGPDTPLVRIVQPNVPQRDKRDPDKVALYMGRMLSETARDPAPALVVWPESALPYLMEYEQPDFETMADLARGAPVVVGLNRRDGTRFYNSLVVVGHGGQILGIHDKAHLVPFGEYIPFGEVFSRFGIEGLAASEGGGFSAGPGLRLLDLPGIGPALPLICYEGIFAEEVGAVVGRPRLMVLITNDAWFGKDAGPQQHLAIERMRAIEQGVPMVRSANTGISAMIDAHGRITASLPLGRAGSIDAPLPPALPPTVYSRWGDGPLFAALIALAALALLGRRNKAIDLGGSPP